MSKLVYIHNPHQEKSRVILEELQNNFSLEILDFMQVRDKYRFRATPTLWILPNVAEVTEKNIAVTLEEDNITPQNVADKLITARAIALTSPKTTITVNEVLRITATMKNLNGDSVPIEPVTFWLSGLMVNDINGILDFSASKAGIYVIETRNNDAVQGYLEVTVSG